MAPYVTPVILKLGGLRIRLQCSISHCAVCGHMSDRKLLHHLSKACGHMVSEQEDMTRLRVNPHNVHLINCNHGSAILAIV